MRDDYEMSLRGMMLQDVTLPDAVIATVWAGAPAYYARRKMIDILGKNDRVVASRAPRGNIRPGHNKWDYDYSIGLLKPDVVFQLVGKTTENEYKKIRQLGFNPVCFDNVKIGYVQKESAQVRWSFLEECR